MNGAPREGVNAQILKLISNAQKTTNRELHRLKPF